MIFEILMIMNAFNGIWSDAYIQQIIQIIIQKELEKLKFFLQKQLGFKDVKLPGEIRDVYKIELKN